MYGGDTSQSSSADTSDSSESPIFSQDASDQQPAPSSLSSASGKGPNPEDLALPEDNPISAMLALKHPEQQKAIMDASIEEMAQSHYSNPNRMANVL